ncbi:MAG TPA: hypothetical protein VFA66_03450 [Gaiellaceae bacterium]|nr:hypothetical protein [Gaiellaceae bacterium]
MVLGGKTVFPITLGNGPPLEGVCPDTGLRGWTEVARAGAKMLRIYPKWTAANVTAQLQAVREQLSAASRFGLRLWVGLYDLANDLSKQAVLQQVVDGLKGSPGLGAWKGCDEPLWGKVDPKGLAAAYQFIRSRDPDHPIVIIQAPRARQGALTVPRLRPYAAAGDIHGVDIYPISHPPGTHAGRPNRDISVVGDVTEILAEAAPGKEHWTTLQIAWSGVIPPKHVPIFPTLRQERFMAYQAIVAGARGLVFFGGDIAKVMNPEDAAAGWNWTFWRTVLKPVLHELTSDSVGPALVAPPAPVTVKTNARDVRLVARQAGRFLYLITVRQSPVANGPVRFSGLPAGIKFGAAMFEYDGKDFRTFRVERGSFTDPFAPHDARVYRFRLR